MEVYCDLCDFKEIFNEYEIPRRCPKCRSLDLRFEKDQDWNQICGLWAMGHGWEGQGQPACSLPQWYVWEDKMEEWRNLKELLKHPDLIIPPAFLMGKGPEVRSKLMAFWLEKSHLTQVWRQAVEELAKSVGSEFGLGFFEPSQAEEVLWSCYPLIRKWGEEYLAYWATKPN